jgi:hypothetical protein
VAFAWLAVSPASAQFSEVITACRFDSKQVCAGVLPDGGALGRCIQEHFAALAPSCQAALVAIAAVRKACDADVAQQCPGAKPGAGHLLFCVKQHYAALSAPCREAIGHAAEHNARGH